MKAYEEIIEFIASGTDPKSIIEFQPSKETKNRVTELLAKEKSIGLTSEEKDELTHFMELEHIMRLTKARARKYLPNE